MIKLYLFFVLMFSLNILLGQSFVGGGGKISDFSEGRDVVEFPVEISGLKNSIDCGFGLKKVCLDVGHNRVSDLKFTLKAPDGTEVWLSNRNGKGGGYYLNTCFQMDGFKGFIHAAKAPFSGVYIPDGDLNAFNNGQDPNGVWCLSVEDLKEEVKGRVTYFSLEFGEHEQCDVSRCSFDDLSGCSTPNDSSMLLPDIVLVDHITKTEYRVDTIVGKRQLRFSAAMANVGDGPLEIRGSNRWYCDGQQVSGSIVCENGFPSRQIVIQNIYSIRNGEFVKDTLEAGTIYYDDNPGHDHYHMDDWVHFYLLKKTKGNDPEKWDKIAFTNKISYCLFDTHHCNDKHGNCRIDGKVYGKENLLNYGFGKYLSCDEGKQGLSVGGVDYYGYNYEGQFMDLPEELPLGEYYIYSIINPASHLKELDYLNNKVLIPVKL